MTDPEEAERKRQAVLQDRSITAELRALQAARRREEPMIESMIAMVAELKAIRTEVTGLNQTVNLALGNASAAVVEVNALREVVLVQADTITGLQKEVNSLNTRMTDMSRWATEIHKWALSQGMPKPDQKGQS